MKRSRYALAALAMLAFCGQPQRSQRPPATQKPADGKAAELRQLIQAVGMTDDPFSYAPYDGERQEEREELTYLIDEALADRGADIDRLADEMVAKYDCEREGDGPVDKGRMRNLLSAEAAGLQHVRYARYAHPYDLNTWLSEILEDPLTIDGWSPSLARTMARARYAEKCLGEEGALDIYLDYHDAMARGDCADAEDIALSIGDRRRWLEVSRYCVPPEMRSEDPRDAEEMRKLAFYDKIAGASEDDLAISAGMVYGDEYARWLPACKTARAGRGMSLDLASTYCVADLISARDGKEGGYPTPDMLDMAPEDIEHLIDGLPPDQQERRCALQASLDQGVWYGQESDEPDESLWPPDRYRRCLEE